MTDSVKDVESPETPAFTRIIEIRIAEPAPRYRYEKGKPVKEPMPDMNRVIRAIEDDITEQVQAVYGEETEVRITVAKVADIRLTGTFPEKATETRKVVGEILGNVMENLELDDD